MSMCLKSPSTKHIWEEHWACGIKAPHHRHDERCPRVFKCVYCGEIGYGVPRQRVHSIEVTGAHL